ncbi:hypothetical protein SCLCIDRAFT_27701 [Scleroderma citrinum Foug A]|uniref:Uncharacterized protein n=1 Tax=Scleroderma citrinum Foug A TaxID=1036808 RepID=A0A0C3DS57_9AGAM|nr:hypothetical protein SCLCIDRAFT_27701 [Scleroderma citrinum Foug A]
MRICSSVVSNVAPKLPRHPGFNAHPRYEFYSSAMTAGCMDPTEAFGSVCGWLHGVCASKVRSSSDHVEAWVQRPYSNVSHHLRVAARFPCVPGAILMQPR